MITFFPGPSQVYPEIKQYLADAFDTGIVSVSHRSGQFNQLSEETIQLLRLKLAIPENYTILYNTSATECWEIIAQSVTRCQSIHFHSGAFGEKWYQYAKAIHPLSRENKMPLNEPLLLDYMDIREEDEIICLTQNETSNATQIDLETMAMVRGAFPQKLIAYDCTSSMAGIHLPFALGDIWFASVQKCFGLPSGLGLLILAPSAVQRIEELGEKSHYNSAHTMLKHMQQFQTSCTPNVLGIYLLNRVLHQIPTIEITEKRIKNRMSQYLNLFGGKDFYPLISNPAVRSSTVLAVEANPQKIREIKDAAMKEGILLGSGYGKWKENTFRIANFPAIQDTDFQRLVQFLTPRVV